jgi:hypothetical protein
MSGKSVICLADISQFQWKSDCHGLYQLPIAA